MWNASRPSHGRSAAPVKNYTAKCLLKQPDSPKDLGYVLVVRSQWQRKQGQAAFSQFSPGRGKANMKATLGKGVTWSISTADITQCNHGFQDRMCILTL